WLTCRGDCDDASPAAYPGAEEACDGVDNDCDDTTVEDVDLDGDGFTMCDGDCDDGAAAALPGGVEVCDGVDNDCDGGVDDLPTCWSCTTYGDHLLCLTSTTWDEAEAACEAFGRTLVSVDDASENSTVASLYTGSALWIGYTDVESEGAWVWISGSNAAFTQWYTGEPNDSGNEDCAATNFGAIGWWNDYPCSYSLPFVCE
ncbi:MAG: lectin-like protein, partial [Myxococcota bacterium]